MLICTICAANDLPKAAVLAASIKRTQESVTTVLCLLERSGSVATEFSSLFSRIITVADIKLVDLDTLLFEHNVYEACSAIKPDVLLWMLQEFSDENQFVFMDPDSVAYSRFEEVSAELKGSPILVTPHHLHDEDDPERICETLLRTLGTGIFNSGFIAVSRSSVSLAFLKWWSSKTHTFCVPEIESGLYCDQRWLDLAVSLHPLQVLRHEGYNVAHWNISRRHIGRSASGYSYVVNDVPLRTFHFSMASQARDLYYLFRYCRADDVVFELRRDYLKEIAAANIDDIATRAWTYDYFDSGEYIHPGVRKLFCIGAPLRNLILNPFSHSNSYLYSEAALLFR